jgi:hypothetical protein
VAASTVDHDELLPGGAIAVGSRLVEDVKAGRFDPE